MPRSNHHLKNGAKNCRKMAGEIAGKMARKFKA
jgi:hypothetical protein